MKKTMKILGMIGMVAICVTACGTQDQQGETKVVQSEQNKNGTVQKTTKDNAEFTISADVNHDGTDEDLKVTVDNEGSGEVVNFVITKEGTDEVLYERKEYPQEKDGMAYYLYNNGTESYLVRYWPQMEQGTADYSYVVFYLNESGEEVITVQEEVGFESYYVSKNFDVAQMTAFADKLNTYLDESVRLFRCDGSEVEISDAKNLIKDREEYGFIQDYDIDYSDCKDMSEKLSKYYEYVQKLESALQE